jgi:hypothetical protein
MKKQSDKKRRISSTISVIKKVKLEKNGGRCFLSGRTWGIEAAHLIRQSYSVALQTDKRNIIPLNAEFHAMMDNGKFRELIEMYPWKCNAIIDRMFSLDFFYTNRYLGRNKMENLKRSL